MIKNMKFFTFSLIAIIFIAFSIGATASAEQNVLPESQIVASKSIPNEKNIKFITQLKSNPNVTFIYDDGNGNASFIPAKTVKNKSEYEALIQNFTAQSNYNITLMDDNQVPFSGNSVHNEFNTNVNVEQGNAFKDYVIIFSGSSKAVWPGSTPIRANKINQTDSFSFNYIGTSATISAPPGLGFTTGSSSATIHYPEITDAWAYYHTYSGIVGKAYMITAAIQSNYATFLFGSSSVSVGTYDSEIVW